MQMITTQEEFEQMRGKDKVTLLCYQCNSEFKKDKRSLRRLNGMYCSKLCQNKSQIKKIVVNCLVCNKELERTQKQIIGNIFCSRSCSAKHNNVYYKKRCGEGNCKSCLTPISTRKNYCDNCKQQKQFFENITLGELRKLPTNIYHGKVRYYSRKLGTQMLPSFCRNCGYDKHVEICHIKPLNEFTDDQTINEANSIDNLVQLCRNCHWEFDHNILVLK